MVHLQERITVILLEAAQCSMLHLDKVKVPGKTSGRYLLLDVDPKYRQIDHSLPLLPHVACLSSQISTHLCNGHQNGLQHVFSAQSQFQTKVQNSSNKTRLVTMELDNQTTIRSLFTGCRPGQKGARSERQVAVDYLCIFPRHLCGIFASVKAPCHTGNHLLKVSFQKVKEHPVTNR